MRPILPLAVALAGLPLPLYAQAEPPLQCYGAETQIGVIAHRDFLDGRGLVIKQILYRSADSAGRPKCSDDAVRVYAIRTITRDSVGRSVVETEISPSGAVERVLRHEYVGDAQEASRDIWSGPDGSRRYEIRRTSSGKASHLYYDERGLVAGVMGVLPRDVQYALRWGTEMDGWSCGIAVTKGSVYVNVKNGTQRETSVAFLDGLEMDLKSVDTGNVPPLAMAGHAASGDSRGVARVVPGGEAAFYTYSLESRYGRLAPGHYMLTVWFPHPLTGARILSNRFEFDVPTGGM